MYRANIFLTHLSCWVYHFPWCGDSLRRLFIRAALFLFKTADDGAQPLDVACDNGQGDITLEAFNAMVRAHVQPVNLQGIDRRFHCGVLLPSMQKFRV